EQRAENLALELGLSADQKAQITRIFTEARQQFQAMRRQSEGAGGDGAAPSAGASSNPAQERQRQFAAVRERVAAVLTPEQRQRYQEMQSQRANADRPTSGRVWVVGGDGKPKAVPVQIGIGDGNVSELVAGDLKQGQDVIIGGGIPVGGTAAGGSGASRPPGPPGMRL
ncbi:MAG: hypothetical protein FJX52_12380, partial [Alphaproteobacteria bacterium]|nr:hypothetical protein [Alphaproteobacteria bacterium]